MRPDLTALARTASRNTSLLSHRLRELARALEHNDENEISYLGEALGPELERTWSLLESVEVELEFRRDR